MDKFARNYAIVIGTIFAIALAWNWLSSDGRVAEINAELAGDLQLADYPYTFRVFSLSEGVATMSSPRSPQVAAMQFLRAAFPALRATGVNHPDMMAAQKTLAEKQSRAAELVISQPDVTAVSWKLDERWFAEHGVFLDLTP